MKMIAPFLLFALAGAAAAQTTPPQSAPEAAQPAARENPSTRDPRACLEFPTRQQVIACAEKYRPRRPAAKS
jgi:hypothetical protein